MSLRSFRNSGSRHGIKMSVARDSENKDVISDGFGAKKWTDIDRDPLMPHDQFLGGTFARLNPQD